LKYNFHSYDLNVTDTDVPVASVTVTIAPEFNPQGLHPAETIAPDRLSQDVEPVISLGYAAMAVTVEANVVYPVHPDVITHPEHPGPVVHSPLTHGPVLVPLLQPAKLPTSSTAVVEPILASSHP
jgi:hypothetical protein